MSFTTLPRPAGDGMDSEDLKYQPYISPKNKLSGRHKNLQATSRTTTIVKNHNLKYIPHEPVRGAVRAVKGLESGRVDPTSVRPEPGHLSVGTVFSAEQNPLCDEFTQHKKTKASLNALPYEYSRASCGPNSNNEIKGSVVSSAYSRQNEFPKTQPGKLVQSKISTESNIQDIQIPVYSGPNHLHMETYRTLQRLDELKKQNEANYKLPNTSTSHQSLGISSETRVSIEEESKHIGNDIVIPLNTELEVENTIIINMDEMRQVEGRAKTMNEQLHDVINKLREELKVQTEVNADLKKMLLASMGDDLHYKVEALVRTKAHLAAEVGGYSSKLYKDYEDLDKLSIEADMWRTKYKATRVLVEQLTNQRGHLSRRCEQSEYALQELLKERKEIKSSLVTTYRYLFTLRDALGPRHKAGLIPQPTNVLDLARGNDKMADSVRFGLLGNMSVGFTPVDQYVTNLQSPAEQLALQVLREQSETEVTSCEIPVIPLPSPTAPFNRWQPNTRFDDLTINCCPHCKGEVIVV